MTDFWVSKDRYWCKYCSIFIADDKPSRIHHETGLKHKGNYERYIRDIYKRGERDKRDKRDEGDEMARIEEAARKAMKADGTLELGETESSPAASTSKASSSASTSKDPYASYTTAADLGFVEHVDPEIERLEKERETREKEGVIGQWEVVKKGPSKTSSSSVVPPPPPEWMQRLPGVKQEELQPKPEEGDQQEQEKDEEDRPTTKKYLKEKTLPLEDDAYDPSTVGPVRLKRKITTLREEQEIREKEEERKRIKREAEEERRKMHAERGEGWREVQVKDEGMMEFDTPEEKPEVKVEGGGVDAKPPLGTTEDEDEKPKPSMGGFKKRKMHGANAIRKK